MLLPLQLTFIFGLWVSLLALDEGRAARAGAEILPRSVGARTGEATVLGGVPSMFRTLLGEAPPAAPKLRKILTGGEVLPPHLADVMRRWSPAEIHDLYGLTETGTCDFHCGPAEQPQGFGSIGRATEQRRLPHRRQTASCKSARPTACWVISTIRP